jgi:hypothetical protein
VKRKAAPKAWILVPVMLISAAAATCRGPAAPRFPHEAHLSRMACGSPGEHACLDCNSCHKSSQTESVPSVAECERCHENERPRLAAVLGSRPARPFGNIAFDHERHLAMPELGGQCLHCHAGVVKAGAASLPPMSQCFSCHVHEQEWNAGVCSPCHEARDLDRLLPQTFLRHEGAFAQKHGHLAMQQAKLCEACHSQSECDDCHDITQRFGVERRRPASLERNFVHRADFVVRHSIEARSEPARCARCHEPETCDGCHLERGVSGNLASGRSPHPPGWISAAPGAASLHGKEARRDILSCAACHEQGPATNCIDCHRVGAHGGNPHPSGWQSSRDTGSTICGYCHG